MINAVYYVLILPIQGALEVVDGSGAAGGKQESRGTGWAEELELHTIHVPLLQHPRGHRRHTRPAKTKHIPKY
jgi:hypothetical protein